MYSHFLNYKHKKKLIEPREWKKEEQAKRVWLNDNLRVPADNKNVKG